MIFKKHGSAFIVLLAVAALLILAQPVHAQATTTSNIIAQSSLVQGFCGGSPVGTGTTTAGSGGIIPTTNILSNQTNGEQSVLNISILIMMVMLIVVALIYMVSYIFNLELLRNLVKSEIGEIFITGIIVAVFLGSFSVLSAATTPQTGFAIAGSSFGRGVYVTDCSYLSTASISLIVPFFAINVVRFFVGAVSSISLDLTPTYFGFSDSPLQGLKLFDTILGYIDTIAGAFILLILGTLSLLSIIYAIFPIFLYAGIVLRTLPWTRAAGGAFLGLFAGFYIVFPLLLSVMLGGYISTITGVTSAASATSATPNTITTFANTIIGTTPTSGSITTVGTFLYNTASSVFSGIGITFTNGIVGGFIAGVIEPALFTILSIIVAFLISFDFAEAMGDILGAPSLRATNIFNKVL
ncbi:MAG: hypothetical protein ABSE71_05420 [Candidatus Micrarchaeaceae archaeon]|jgi:hypothetical protein